MASVAICSRATKRACSVVYIDCLLLMCTESGQLREIEDFVEVERNGFKL